MLPQPCHHDGTIRHCRPPICRLNTHNQVNITESKISSVTILIIKMWPRIGPRLSDAPFSHERLFLGSFPGDGPSLGPSQSTGRLNLKKRGQNLDCFASERILGSSPTHSLCQTTRKGPIPEALCLEEGVPPTWDIEGVFTKVTKSAPKGLTVWSSTSPSLSWLCTGISWVVLRNCCCPGHTHTYLGIRPRHEGLFKLPNDPRVQLYCT